MTKPHGGLWLLPISWLLEVVGMAAPAYEQPFDPLVDLDGMWTPELAERYLPIEGAPPVRYEAVNGKLVMSPREGSANSWATTRLIIKLDPPVRAAGHALYSSLNVLLSPKTWIEPDLVVLREPVVDLTWVPAEHVLMPVEFVSPSSRRRDRFDKAALAAQAGIPFSLRVEISRQANAAEIHLFQLDGGRYRAVAAALAGETFSAARPFELSFDPGELLEPEP